ncbi:hypothetical protein A2U01_0096712, partial [Trifolium medium]|nr:hypothetical protein [Trifolium medium]
MIQARFEVAAEVQGSGREQTFRLHKEEVMYLERAQSSLALIM